MILTCPACATQYRLKDGAIPPEGRQVRCAACKHKWHQDGDAAGTEPAGDARESEDAIGQWPVASGRSAGGEEGIAGGPPQPETDQLEVPVAAIPDAAAHEQMIAETPEPDVAGADGGQGVDGSYAPAGAGPVASSEDYGEADEVYASDEQGFAAIPAMHDDDEPHRSGKLGWIVALILLVVAAAAAFYFLAPPELRARAGIAEAGESPLQLMLTTSDRQKLASGNELLAISGRVINATDREQAVPPIHAELRDPGSNKLVYQWTIAPPARSLAPGAAASFNSAEVDVPEGGDNLSLRFAS